MLPVAVLCLGLAFVVKATSSQRPYQHERTWRDRNWAQYTPFYPVRPYEGPPEGCIIDQVNIIQRHGARYPTDGAAERIVTALDHFKTATEFNNPNLTFLANYTYDLGTNDLIRFGAAESAEAGKTTYDRYWGLVNANTLPFVRASSSERCVLSATNWTLGFSLASRKVFQPEVSVIISEELNDTLDDAMCPSAGDSSTQTDQWLSVYADPLAAKLNAEAPGATLSGTDVHNLISMCSFDTLAKEKPSPFCSIFSDADFQNFEYSGALDKYYKTGYGQDLGPVQGVGYINELIARLTNSTVEDNTQTNRTLDSDPSTFPLGKTIYADFSHDNQMIAIYAAMGLFRQSTPLDPSSASGVRTWKASEMVPFAARMVTERLSCRGVEGGEENEAYVRILVNDAVQPLEMCGSGNGKCKLDAFVESQAYSRNDGEGDFERCFVEV